MTTFVVTHVHRVLIKCLLLVKKPVTSITKLYTSCEKIWQCKLSLVTSHCFKKFYKQTTFMKAIFVSHFFWLVKDFSNHLLKCIYLTNWRPQCFACIPPKECIKRHFRAFTLQNNIFWGMCWDPWKKLSTRQLLTSCC